MVYIKRPVCGAKTRILPSDQPDRMLPPSGMKDTHLHSTLGQETRKSSLASETCQTLTSEEPAVANTSL